LVGTLAAAVSGYLAISFLLRLVRTTSYRPFVLYRYVAGAAILLSLAHRSAARHLLGQQNLRAGPPRHSFAAISVCPVRHL